MNVKKNNNPLLILYFTMILTMSLFISGCSNKEVENVIQETKNDNHTGVEEITYYSDYLGTNRKANVYFPCGYSQDIKYNVVYLLHGMGGDYNSYNELNVLQKAQNIIESYNLEPMILVSMTVFCDTEGKSEDDYTFTQLAQKYDNCIYDIVESLIPYIDSHYQTNKGREHTGICGYSLGGREALYLAYSHPECFGYVGAFSPVSGVVETGSNNFTSDGKALLENFDLDKDYEQPKTIVIVVGTEDPHCLKSSKEYDAYMTKSGINHTFYTMSGGHEASVWDDGLETFLKNVFR